MSHSNNSNIFFVSDTHFGHDNIIKYSNRPCNNVHEMNEMITDNWNKVVMPSDTVYHLGDFAFGGGSNNPEKYFNRLNGNKHFINGNHDNKKTLNLPWKSINNMLELSVGKQRIVLCHYAMRVWHHSYKGVWMLYGHSHSTLPETSALSFDVGVDAWDYSPISFDQIKKKMDWKKNNPEYFEIHFAKSNNEIRTDSEMNICAKKIQELNREILSDDI